jgi:hypothetical protein
MPASQYFMARSALQVALCYLYLEICIVLGHKKPPKVVSNLRGSLHSGLPFGSAPWSI